MIGYAMCGSFCTHAQSIAQLETLVAGGYEIQPIMSQTVYTYQRKQYRSLRPRANGC